MKDAVECKLFGTGLESFTVGSHEFYMGYAVKNGIMATLDMGHFHPTEETYDKISAMLLFTPEILLHVSRPVRWDSDHVVILNDSVQMLAQEIVWADALNKVNIGLDYFDASINRIGAYVIGSRAESFPAGAAFSDQATARLRVVGPLLPAPRTARRVEEHAVGSRVRLLLPEKQRSGSRGLHRYD